MCAILATDSINSKRVWGVVMWVQSLNNTSLRVLVYEIYNYSRLRFWDLCLCKWYGALSSTYITPYSLNNKICSTPPEWRSSIRRAFCERRVCNITSVTLHHGWLTIYGRVKNRPVIPDFDWWRFLSTERSAALMMMDSLGSLFYIEGPVLPSKRQPATRSTAH